MRYFILFLLLISGVAYGQTTYYIQADSVRFRKIGANSEFILENATRSITGVLVNYGNGRTRFSKPRINGDTLFIGVDTILGLGASGSAWLLTGNTGTNAATNWVGTNDSMYLRFKVNGRDAGFIPRSGMGASNIVVSYSNILLTYGQLAGKSLIPKVIAGTESGSGNHLWGPGAGMYLSESYDTTVGTTSSENMLFGTGSGHFMQKRGTGLASVGRNFFFAISGCMYCTDAAENTGIGAFAMETGFSAFKNFAGGSNALRTANSSRLMTATGAYASAYSGGVISAVTINSSSSDWTNATVTFSAPYSHGSPGACSQTATGTVTIAGGQITGIVITNPGCGYSSRTQTFFTGFTSWFPTVTITGDGTSVSATVTVLQAEGTTSNGHAAGWLVRAPQYQLYLGEGSEPSTRYWDAYGGAIGKGAGIHSSINALQKITNGWAVGTNAKVAADRTFVIGAPIGDSTLKFVLNGISGDSIATINGGGLNIASAGGGLKVTGLASPYSGHYTMPIVTSTGSVINGWVTQDVGGSAILRNDDVARGTVTTNGFLGLFRNSYAGDATSTATPMFYVNTASNSSTQKYMYAALAPNMAVGSWISNYIGYRASTRNNFLHTFVLVGSGSTGNYMEEQFQGVANISRRYASGNSTFGSTVTADGGYLMEVGGKTKINDSLRSLSGVKFSGLPTTAQVRVIMIDPDGELHSVDTTGLFAGGGGGGSPAGNYGNIQLNRNSTLSTPVSDSLDYENSGGLKVKNSITARIDVTAKQTYIGTDGSDSYPGIWQGDNATSPATNNASLIRFPTFGTVVNAVSGEFVELRVANDFSTNNVRWDGTGLRVGGAGSNATAKIDIQGGGIDMTNGTPPGSSITNGVRLYPEDVAASSELKVRDEAGNITVLSPHNFTGIPQGKSEEMAWSFYSEKDGKYVNVDMLKLARLVEKLTGEKLVYTGDVKDKPNKENK